MTNKPARSIQTEFGGGTWPGTGTCTPALKNNLLVFTNFQKIEKLPILKYGKTNRRTKGRDEF